jgi:hypothetical protein
MKRFRITYTVISGEYEHTAELFVRAGAMNDEQAAREVAAQWAKTPPERQVLQTQLYEEDFAEVPGQALAIEEVFWREVKPLTVIVQGGVVQEVSNIPENVQVKVIDWDDDLSGKDEEPAPAVTIWG